MTKYVINMTKYVINMTKYDINITTFLYYQHYTLHITFYKS